MRHILFGDSIAFGVGDYENGGWATQLRLFIDRQKKAKNHNLINLSISGDTSRGLLARFERELKLRMRDKSPEEFRIIFAIGANDSREIREHPDQEISLEEYKKNILQLIQLAKALSKEVVIVGLFPADEKLSTPYKEDKFYFNQKLEKYNNALREIAADEGLQFVDIFASLLSQDYLQLLADGLHPNTAGHQFIFEAVKKALF